MTTLGGRFPDCDQSRFPEIINYNFRENPPHRGLQQRTFRWEDVTVRAVYLYKEVTASGNFEIHNYDPENPTGAQFLTNESTLVDTLSFPGWTLTGGYTLWIGESGNTIHTEDLSGLKTDLYVYPLVNNVAVGMYSQEDYSSAPRLISNNIPSGSGNNSITEDLVHQVYLVAKTNYSLDGGTGEYLSAHVRGWSSDTVVAYYNPQLEEWQLTPPQTGFFIPTDGYTEIKYTFIPQNFPAATPTGYDLEIVQLTTGGFITVDDIHIDRRLLKNPFIDEILPSHYIIEMTPDLGWHDPLMMFSNDTVANNPHLKILGPFSIEAGNLIDNLDNTVSVTIDEDQFSEIINERYNNYLWRAVAVNEDGILGYLGPINKFTYIRNEVFNNFSVLDVTELEDNTTKIISGTKSKDSTILIDGTPDHPGLSYPTSITWKLVLHISEPRRTVSIQATYFSALSSIKYVELFNRVLEQNYQALWNNFDEHGLVMDIERLPSETNTDYESRIKDVYRNRGGVSFVGIVNGATRELGLDKISDALLISIATSQSKPKYGSVLVQVNSTNIRYHTDNMIIEELLYVDPIHLTIDLTHQLAEFPIHAERYDGKYLNISQLEVHKDTEEFPDISRLLIKDQTLGGKFIYIAYKYYKTINFKDYPTLADLVVAINNDNIIHASLADILAGNEDSLGLYMTSFIINGSQSVPLSWSPVYLKKISDKAFREYNHDTVNYKTSKFYKYVSELKSNSRVLWGSVEADRDYWDAADRSDLSFDVVPTLADPPLAEFYTTDSKRVESVQAWGQDYRGNDAERLSNLGILSSVFQAGVADKESLKPLLEIVATNNNIKSLDNYSNTTNIRLNNNRIIFSGQR